MRILRSPAILSRVTKYDVLVIGGGAAGLMCAITAAGRGRTVGVLDHAERIGKKIGISGGGRCNFTNLNASAENYLSQNPDFCKSALARYTPSDFIALVEKHRIAYHEKKLGQLFCDQSSKQIIQMLLDECAAAGVRIHLNCGVSAVSKDGSFRVRTGREEFASQTLVIATGGLSFPRIGATDFGYRIARQFDLATTELRPGLVPLTFNERDAADFAGLSGISIDTRVSCRGKTFRENTLVTHRGLSGPAILQISSYWREGDALQIDLLPGKDTEALFQAEARSQAELSTVLSQFLSRRFVLKWCERNAASKPMARYTQRELAAIRQQLHNWQVRMEGTEGYGKAEVTLGGVSTTELSSKTMECRRVPGLYLIGELVDVTGWLGGYNFQWAWASGFAAGQYV
jgi:predicted Rossmann fold flavoprotein